MSTTVYAASFSPVQASQGGSAWTLMPSAQSVPASPNGALMASLRSALGAIGGGYVTTTVAPGTNLGFMFGAFEGYDFPFDPSLVLFKGRLRAMVRMRGNGTATVVLSCAVGGQFYAALTDTFTNYAFDIPATDPPYPASPLSPLFLQVSPTTNAQTFPAFVADASTEASQQQNTASGTSGQTVEIDSMWFEAMDTPGSSSTMRTPMKVFGSPCLQTR